MSTTQDTNDNGGENDEQQLYDTVQENTKMSRRRMMQTTLGTAGVVAGGVAATDRYAPQYSPVQGAEAIPAVVAWPIAAAAGAGAKAVYDYYTTPEEDMTKTQLHRTLRSVARGMDASRDEESEFENLVAERSSNWVWQDAVKEFEKGFNRTGEDAPGIEELKQQMETSILSDYSDFEQTIVDNQTTEVVQLLEMWNMVDSYEHQDSMGEFFKYHKSLHNNENHKVWEACNPTGDSSELEAYGLTGDEDVLRPFSDYYAGNHQTVKDGKQAVEGVENENYGALKDIDDLVYIDYEKVDGSTMPAAIGWGNVVFYNGNTFTYSDLNYTSGAWTYYDDGDDGDGITNIKINNGEPGALPWDFQVTDPDGSDTYTFLDFARRGQAISTIRDEATSLAGEVNAWVDQIADHYARGDLPMADVVSTSYLWEEYSYEEGSPSMTALAASQLGFETDLRGTATVTDYGSIEYSDGDELPDDGDTHHGYLIFDVSDGAESPTLTAGETYDARDLSGVNSVGITQPSGTTHELAGVFTLDEIRSYEDGETVNKDEFTPDSYTFSPRDPDRYSDDVDDANNAREDATENPDFSDLFGGGIGWPSASDIPLWLLAIPGGFLLVLVLGLFAKVAGD